MKHGGRFGRRRLEVLAVAVGIVCAAQATFADECHDGMDYQTVDYFAPPRTDNHLYIDQGGYHLSLCNTPHTLPRSARAARAEPCERIDLKGYLYLPAPDAGPIPGSVDSTGPVATGFVGPIVSGRFVHTTDHDLPLVVFVGGSWANADADHAEVPNPNPYPNFCAMGRYFTRRGYAFLAIVRRGYSPSTGTNEMVRFAPANDSTRGRTKNKRVLDYLANESFEVQEAIKYMVGLDSLSQNMSGAPLPVVDRQKIALMGHSLGAIVGLFYGDANNLDPIADASDSSAIPDFPKAKVIIAAASQSWDGFDLEKGASGMNGELDDQSDSIRQLKRAAQGSPFPTYFFEPLNDASTRPTAVLSKAMADFNLSAERTCRLDVYSDATPYPRADGATDAASEIVIKCSPASNERAGLESQATLFPAVDVVGLGYPVGTSAHGPFITAPSQVAIWGGTVTDFIARYGVMPTP